MNPNEICNLKCLNEKNIRIEDIINKAKLSNAEEIVLPYKLNGYYLCYAPVGNYTNDPFVIISGKTTSGDSSDLFRNYIYENKPLYDACMMSIYSNMKNRLFNYLNEIKLFDYLKRISNYWRSENFFDKWNKIFTTKIDSLNSGIQITQAFNCAILNNEKSERSSQPLKKIFGILQKDIGCMFEHFNISDNLKLIIFLDTPGNNNSFHQINFWNEYFKNRVNKNVRIISITHPSSQNSQIYNNLDNLEEIKNYKIKNAIKLLENAKSAIQELSRSIYE